MTKKRGRPKGSKNKKKVIEHNKVDRELNLARAKASFVTGMFVNFPVFTTFIFLYAIGLEISGDTKEIKKEWKNEQV